MTAQYRKCRSVGWTGIVAVLLATPPLVRAGSWLDDFDSDPFDVWTIDTGPGDGFGDNALEQFTYDAVANELIVEYDSSLPTVRLERELQRVFTEFDAFAFSATLRFDSIEAPPEDYMQISLALTNSETTGAHRTGSFNPYVDANTFDNVELAYYPNISADFGGPYVSATVQGSAQGSLSAFDHISFDSVEYPLPLGTNLEFTGHYNPLTTTLTYRVGDLASVSIDITEPIFGLPAGTFAVDRFAITTYFDGADFNPETVSLRATVSYDSSQFLALGDGDNDDDVDLLDFGAFQRCFAGGGVAVEEGCEVHDFDGDADVDLGDFAVFQYVISGPLWARGEGDSGN